MALVRSALLALLLAAFLALWMRPSPTPSRDAFEGKTFVLTGASSGIGAELAVQLGALGARLVLAARREGELRAVAEQARAAGAQQVVAVPTDLARAEDCRRLVLEAAAAFDGRLDFLVLNAALVDEGTLITDYHAWEGETEDEGEDEDLERMVSLFRVNTLSAARLVRAALPLLEASRGTVSVISSGSVRVPAAFHPGYVTTKTATHGLVASLQSELELTGRPVRVQTLILGMIATPEVTQYPELARGIAMPVPHCAASIVADLAAGHPETYIPRYLAPWVWLIYHDPSALVPPAWRALGGWMSSSPLGWLGSFSMNSQYVRKVPPYRRRIQQLQHNASAAAAAAARLVARARAALAPAAAPAAP